MVLGSRRSARLRSSAFEDDPVDVGSGGEAPLATHTQQTRGGGRSVAGSAGTIVSLAFGVVALGVYLARRAR